MSTRRLSPRAVSAAALQYLLLGLLAFLMVFPFLWMASTSLKSFGEAFAYPPTLLPRAWRWSNYGEIFNAMPMTRFLLNSCKITGLTVLGMLLSCSMAAFALARLEFPGKRLLFASTLATLMVPYQVTLIPVFILFQYLGWKDTHYPLWVPAFFGGAFGVFLLRQFFIGVPKDLYEAALVDGSTPGGILFRIYLPLAKPALTTLGVFTFMASWNDLLNPLIYIDTLEKMPLTAGLSFLQTQYGSDWPLMMAGAMISILPILAIFFVAQRAFIQGIATAGLKG
ncbi:MAG: multiple sugar transport system permease protein [Candidatus Sumerlaeota bacterium]|nr:multiple sugar transport system permease protein [Candidatus Sumerlaeota bacterium]